jgi:tetratricopeptide (TPR) repeat protein
VSALQFSERGGRLLLYALPGLAAFVLFDVWGAYEGGYSLTTWLPGTLFLLGVTLVLIGGLPQLRPAWGSAATASVCLFGAFTVWSFCSIAWAQVKGDAWDGANRTLLYFVVFVLFTRPLWTVPRAVVVLIAWAVGASIVGLVTLQDVIHAAHPSTSFIGSRLSEPFGYANGTAAFFLMPVWPMLAISSRREQPIWVRAVCLGLACFLAELGFVPESRGMLFALPLAAVAWVALMPNRLRSLVPLLIVLASWGVVSGPLLDVYRSRGDEGLRAATVSARNAIIISTLVLIVVGAAYAWLDQKYALSATTARKLTLAAAALVVAVCVVGGIVALATAHPIHQVERGWRAFKSPHEPQGPSSHFTGLGSNRYDFWRVSILIFKKHPLQGVGADNFAVDYLKLRHSQEQPLYPHSIEMRLLTSTGLIGTLLFAAFLVVATVAALRRAEPAVRAVGAGALTATAYWLLHGSGDWLWEFPALGGAGIAALGLAVGLNSQPAPVTRPRPAVWGHTAAVVTGVVAVLAAVSLVLPWWAQSRVDSAVSSWHTNSGQAYDELRTAHDVNRLSDTADVTAGTIAARVKDWGQMQRSFEAAVKRNPYNWYSHLELGVVATVNGRFEEALAHLRKAHSLNPREELIGFALGKAERRQRIDPGVMDRALIRSLPVQ